MTPKHLIAPAFIAVVGLLSCSTHDCQKALEKENQELKHEIKNLKRQIGAYSFRPVVVAKSSKVKVGEEYIADVSLAMVDTTHPPIVIIGKWDSVTHEFISSGDTLKYDKEFEGTVFREKATLKGKRQWAGKIIQQIDERNNEYGFNMNYEVVNN